MKTLEIIGYHRANLGKKASKDLRNEALTPCVLYGGDKQVHFSVPMVQFKKLIYTPEVHIVELNIEGDRYRSIMQDAQFHPVSEVVLHVDFLQLFDDKQVKIDVPLKLQGSAPGVQKGGKLVQKVTKVRVQALPKNLPDAINLDVSGLDLGQSVRVRDIVTDDYKILTSGLVTVATVNIPRALKGK
ncbi:MAG: 50S ribosomal protein L25/general stress protein Ctc [Bernardetiaceae bacterium]|jgi:large subunit ribosomal protein L25|nr:50S ribosomal protein L25/general stress protein Ctc [Bernardetiaceae bacterium]